jgi:light-regulated signal transduction histidine kinase (bacteriophytochrome)
MGNRILTQTKVMLVEDEPGHIDFISYLLQQLGVEDYRVASTETDAIQAFRDFRPDIALLDVDLKQGGSGIHVAKAIKAESDIPIIFITANYDTATFAEVKKLKPHSFLDKEVNEMKLRQSLELALQDHAELMEKKRDTESFSFVASHDLKEPLRNITSFAALLERELGEKLTPAAKDYLGFIKMGGQRMNSLIAGILENANLSNREATKHTAVDLNQVFTEARDFVQKEFKHCAVLSEPLPILLSDRNLLGFVFKNLLHNALKFNQAELATVQVSSETKNGQVILYFTDNGIGIPEADAEKVFEPFKRLHPKALYDGAGLGLTISKKAVEKLGGNICVKRREGGGSIFEITL